MYITGTAPTPTSIARLFLRKRNNIWKIQNQNYVTTKNSCSVYKFTNYNKNTHVYNAPPPPPPPPPPISSLALQYFIKFLLHVMEYFSKLLYLQTLYNSFEKYLI